MAPPYDAWDRLSDLARRAPSPHNTQPFRLRPRSDSEADLVLLCERLLPVEDRGNRYVLSSCGLFADALEQAGRAEGFAVDLRLRDDVDPAALRLDDGERLLGTVHLTPGAAPDPDAARLLLTRRTSRLPYQPDPVSPDRIAAFMALASSFGHHLIVPNDPDAVRWVLRQNARALIDNLQIGDDRREIERWTRLGDTPAHGDGLWRTPLHQPAWELRLAFGLPWLFRLPILSHWAIHRYLATQTGTPHVALLAGPFAAWPDLVRAGRLLGALWRAMTAAGVYLHPFGSTLTNPHHARIIGERFGAADGWLLFRFGHSDVPPEAPRVASVVLR